MKLYIAVGAIMLVAVTLFILLFHKNRQVRHMLTLNELREANRKELLAATLQGQEAERRRLARDLHDEIGTMLSVTKLSLNQLERRLASIPSQSFSNPAPCDAGAIQGSSHQQMQKTRALLDETMSNVRRISRDLVPTTLERFGLLAAIEELTEQAGSSGTTILVEASSSLLRLTAAQELLFYRIAQELVSNALRHAAATQVDVQFVCLEDAVRMSVLDNGRGFDYDDVVKDNHSSVGLRTIESRLSVIDGHATFDVAPGRGSRIHIQIKVGG